MSARRVTLAPGPRRGTVRAPSSKSQAHRLLIAAALGDRPCELRLDGLSLDLIATMDCLLSLGASIRRSGEKGETGYLVTPLRAVPPGTRELCCGESGSTLRFLLPVCGALGVPALFHREGRLPERPLAPLDALLRARGMTITAEGPALRCGGALRPGPYPIAGNVSSQYISGLLMALPLLPGESTLEITGPLESAPYVAMTEAALRLCGVRFEKQGTRYRIPGNQRAAPPARLEVEGDWSNAAFFLCMGALSETGVHVTGLSGDSAQGDRAALELLRGFGASVEETDGGVTVRRGALRAQTIDAASVPDLVPALGALAAAVPGETRIVHAARLRDKESDRLRTTAAMLTALGASAEETPDGLRIQGAPALRGGTVRAANDHRIAMAAAVAACACREAVTVEGADCAEKSYPGFWDALAGLEGDGPWRSM